MRTVIKKTNDNREIEVETDEREYSKPNEYYIDITPITGKDDTEEEE